MGAAWRVIHDTAPLGWALTVGSSLSCVLRLQGDMKRLGARVRALETDGRDQQTDDRGGPA